MLQLRFLIALVASASLAFALGLETPENDLVLPPPVPEDVHELVILGKVEKALIALEGLREGDPSGDGTWSYAIALTQERAGRDAEALAQLDQLLEEQPGSPLAGKARFARARILGQLDRHAEAAEVFGQAAERLGSEARRDELVSLCVSLADQIEARSGQLESERAAALGQVEAVLNEALQLEPSLAIELRLRLRLASVMSELEQHGPAAEQLALWLGAVEAQVASGGALPALAPGEVARQRLEHAAALARAQQYDQADDAYAELIADADESPGDLVRAAKLGRARVLVARAQASDLEDADALFEGYLLDYPEAPERVQVATELAQLSQRQGRDASQAWRRVIGMQPALESEQQQAATLVRAATWQLARSQQDAGSLDEAIATYRLYVARYPDGPQWSASQQAILSAELEIAERAKDAEEYATARAAWRGFLSAHPLDSHALDVARAIADSFVEEADGLEDAQQAGSLFAAAVAELERLVQKNPGSDAASRALFTIGDLEETRLDDLDGAIAAWQRCNFGSQAKAAATRLARLQDRSLALATPRTLRTTEPPTVELRTRNLDSVQVEVYQLDLESYFRRHQTDRHVEDLDLDLIQADAVFTHQIEAARPHAEVTEELNLPADLVAGPGTWIVSVLSRTRRATTLLRVSDIDVVLDTAGDDAVVFAEDMLREVPAEGVELLLIQGGQVIEAKTDAQGLAHFSLQPGQGALQLFAERAGHSATVGFGKAQRTSQPVAPAAFIYTDRGVYRRGERVFWKAILRQRTSAGDLAFEPGQRFDVSVLAPTGLALFDKELSTSVFGTLFGDLELPDSAPEGNYTIRVQDGARVHTASFEVRRFAVPKMRLEVEVERPILLVGQDQRLAMHASYSHGAPVVGARISGWLQTEHTQRYELVTDAEGNASLEIAARELGDVSQVAFEFDLEAEAQASGRFFRAGRELELGLRTTRSLYLAGEAFGVEVSAMDVYGKPTARQLELTVERLEQNRQGKLFGVELERHEVTTDAAGKGRLELRLEDGGRYRLRVEGLDLLEQPVSRELEVTIAPRDDTEELRFLVDSSEYEVGDQVSLRLHNNGPAGPALVTRIRAGILAHELVQLGEGDNQIRFTAGLAESPGAALRVTRIRADQMHSVSQRYQVTRAIEVQVLPPEGEHKPGDVVEVELRVTDAHGRPVQTELSLGLVDAAFYERFPERYTKLLESFPLGASPEQLGGVQSSAGFRYTAATQLIPGALLAEREQQKLAEQLAGRIEEGKEYLEKSTGRGIVYKGPGDMQPPRARAALEALGYASDEFNDVIGVGGGGGGHFGSRGGRRSLKAGSAALDPALDSPTQFWAPAVVTDAEGQAQLRIELPARGGRWRFTSRAVDKTARVGETTAEITTRADLLVELLAPGALYFGDTLEPRARVFWSGAGQGRAQLEFTRQVQGRAASRESLEVRFDGPGVQSVAFGKATVGSETGTLLLNLSARLESDGGSVTEARDALGIELRPLGIELEDLAGGLLEGPERANLELPTRSARARRVEVYLGAGLGDELVDAALGKQPLTPLASAWGLGSFGRSTIDLASDLLGTSAVLAAMQDMGPASAGRASLLERRARSLANELLLRQSSDGSFGAYPGWWDGSNKGSRSSDEVTAMALIGLQRAGGLLELPAAKLDLAAGFLQARLLGLTAGQEEARAMALHALVVAGQGGADLLSGLWRVRAELNPAARAHLALAYASLGRGSYASELAQTLEADATGVRSFGATECGTWNREPAGMNALVVWALAQALPDSPRLEPAARELLGQAPWSSGRVRGMALAGLVAWRRGALESGASLRARVRLLAPTGSSLADQERQLFVPAGQAGASLTFELTEAWPQGPVELELQVESDGRERSAGWQPTWHARLRGFATDFGALTAGSDRTTRLTMLASAPLFEHTALKTGFGILKRVDETWKNEVTELPRGARVKVQVDSQTNWRPGQARGGSMLPDGYTVLEVPFPAGTQLVPGSIQPSGANWQVTPSGLTSQQPGGSWSLSFELTATRTGRFSTPPAVVREGTDPALISVSKPIGLTVLGASETSSDCYRATPDERLDHGQRLFDAGRDAEAWPLLSGLSQQYNGDLREDVRKVLDADLLELSIRRGEQAAVVRYFEDLSAVDPAYYLSLDDILAIGQAYSGLGEHERAQTLYLATLGEHFRRDMQLVGVLETHAGFNASCALQERLWHDYPDLPSVVETRLALTDALLVQAPLAHQDPELVAQGRDQVSLTLEAILFLRQFLLLYPNSELAPQAGMNLLSAYTELKDYPRAANLAEQLATRFHAPRLRDNFRYTRAVALWQTGDEDAALALLSAIAEAEYPSGRSMVPSENRDLALYLMAQIRHAQGKLELADSLYARVAEAFPDAKELDALLHKKALFVDEVASVRPGEPAHLEISSKGLPEVELQVFPVDLLALYLRDGDLEDVSSINLAGITPTMRETRTLDARLGMQPVVTDLELEPFDPGAYLVILRGSELFASGLVVVSDLDLFVSEDPATGGVRAQVTRDGSPLEGVDVRIVGSARPEQFTSLTTDRRGLVRALGLGGTATVVARADRTSYAFHRGQVNLGGEASKRTGSSDWFLGQGEDKQDVDWLQNVSNSNVLLQSDRAGRQDALRNKANKGVQILSVQ